MATSKIKVRFYSKFNFHFDFLCVEEELAGIEYWKWSTKKRTRITCNGIMRNIWLLYVIFNFFLPLECVPTFCASKKSVLVNRAGNLSLFAFSYNSKRPQFCYPKQCNVQMARCTNCRQFEFAESWRWDCIKKICFIFGSWHLARGRMAKMPHQLDIRSLERCCYSSFTERMGERERESSSKFQVCKCYALRLEHWARYSANEENVTNIGEHGTFGMIMKNCMNLHNYLWALSENIRYASAFAS